MTDSKIFLKQLEDKIDYLIQNKKVRRSKEFFKVLDEIIILAIKSKFTKEEIERIKSWGKIYLMGSDNKKFDESLLKKIEEVSL